MKGHIAQLQFVAHQDEPVNEHRSVMGSDAQLFVEKLRPDGVVRFPLFVDEVVVNVGDVLCAKLGVPPVVPVDVGDWLRSTNDLRWLNRRTANVRRTLRSAL